MPGGVGVEGDEHVPLGQRCDLIEGCQLACGQGGPQRGDDDEVVADVPGGRLDGAGVEWAFHDGQVRAGPQPADRFRVQPVGQVGLAEQHRAGRVEVLRDGRVGGGVRAADEGDHAPLRVESCNPWQEPTSAYPRTSPSSATTTSPMERPARHH